MILLGWGKDAKKIADLGISKCVNCRNYAWFEMYEVSRRVRAYFIPIAKYGLEYFTVCSVCSHGNSISKDQKEEVLKHSITIPELNTVMAIWKQLSDITDKMKQEKHDNSNLDENDLRQRAYPLTENYGNDTLEYVMKQYLKYIDDDDLPK